MYYNTTTNEVSAGLRFIEEGKKNWEKYSWTLVHPKIMLFNLMMCSRLFIVAFIILLLPSVHCSAGPGYILSFSENNEISSDHWAVFKGNQDWVALMSKPIALFWERFLT